MFSSSHRHGRAAPVEGRALRRVWGWGQGVGIRISPVRQPTRHSRLCGGSAGLNTDVRVCAAIGLYKVILGRKVLMLMV